MVSLLSITLFSRKTQLGQVKNHYMYAIDGKDLRWIGKTRRCIVVLSFLVYSRHTNAKLILSRVFLTRHAELNSATKKKIEVLSVVKLSKQQLVIDHNSVMPVLAHTNNVRRDDATLYDT